MGGKSEEQITKRSGKISMREGVESHELSQATNFLGLRTQQESRDQLWGEVFPKRGGKG